jgi:hypothetical protein
MLAWKRHADQKGVGLVFQDLSVNLTHLIQLYGVTEFL